MRYSIIASCHTDNGGWALTINDLETETELEARQALQATRWEAAEAPPEAWNQTLTLKAGGRTIATRRIGDAGNASALQTARERRECLGRFAAEASPASRAWAVAATCYAALNHFVKVVEAEGGVMAAEATGEQLITAMVKEMGLDKAIAYDAFTVLDWAGSIFYCGNFKLQRELRTICGITF